MARHGDPAYARIDAAADREQKAKLAALSPDDVTATELAGEPITAKLTKAPGNGAAIGGLKVTTESAWFAARPSGTEDVYKIYAESFKGADHLHLVQDEAREVVSAALGLTAGFPGQPGETVTCRPLHRPTRRRDRPTSPTAARVAQPTTGVVRSTIERRSVPTGSVPSVPL